MKLSKYLNIGLAISISSFFYLYHHRKVIGYRFGGFNIPNQIPPFSDLDSSIELY